MKKIKTVLGLVLVALSLLTATSCNKNLFDGFNNEFYYIVVKEGNEYHMHQISSWSDDSSSDSVSFTTKCCDNYIWTTANNAILYKNLPNDLDIKKCSSWKK